MPKSIPKAMKGSSSFDCEESPSVFTSSGVDEVIASGHIPSRNEANVLSVGNGECAECGWKKEESGITFYDLAFK